MRGLAMTVMSQRLGLLNRASMTEWTNPANELVDEGSSGVTIQDEHGHPYVESDFARLGQKATTEQ